MDKYKFPIQQPDGRYLIWSTRLDTIVDYNLSHHHLVAELLGHELIELTFLSRDTIAGNWGDAKFQRKMYNYELDRLEDKLQTILAAEPIFSSDKAVFAPFDEAIYRFGFNRGATRANEVLRNIGLPERGLPDYVNSWKQMGLLDV